MTVHKRLLRRSEHDRNEATVGNRPHISADNRLLASVQKREADWLYEYALPRLGNRADPLAVRACDAASAAANACDPDGLDLTPYWDALSLDQRGIVLDVARMSVALAMQVTGFIDGERRADTHASEKRAADARA